MNFNIDLNNLNQSTTELKKIEAGTYVARLSKVLYLGLQKQKPFQGQSKPDANDIILSWQLTNDLRNDGTPFYLNSRFAYSTGEKSHTVGHFKKLMEASGKNGNCFEDFIGTAVIIEVKANPTTGKIYHSVLPDSVRPAFMVDPITKQRKNYDVPELVEPPVIFNFYQPDFLVFNSLAISTNNFIQDNVVNAVNYDKDCLPAMRISFKKACKEGKFNHQFEGIPWYLSDADKRTTPAKEQPKPAIPESKPAIPQISGMSNPTPVVEQPSPAVEQPSSEIDDVLGEKEDDNIDEIFGDVNWNDNSSISDNEIEEWENEIKF